MRIKPQVVALIMLGFLNVFCAAFNATLVVLNGDWFSVGVMLLNAGAAGLCFHTARVIQGGWA